MKLKYLFGATGFIALLGFIGVFSSEKAFLAFFAFAVDFQYFFVRDDEMWNLYMCRSAARAFCCGMITMALSFLSYLVKARHMHLSEVLQQDGLQLLQQMQCLSPYIISAQEEH